MLHQRKKALVNQAPSTHDPERSLGPMQLGTLTQPGSRLDGRSFNPKFAIETPSQGTGDLKDYP
jgi:hypothetical protein